MSHATAVAELESFAQGPDNIVDEATLRVFGGDSHTARLEAATDYMEAMSDLSYVVTCDSFECTSKTSENGVSYVEFRYFKA